MLLNYFLSNNEPTGSKEHEDQTHFKRRIKKTLYHASKTNKPSLSLTELTVDYMKLTAPRQLGKTDMYTTSAIIKDTFVPPCTLIVAMMYAQRLRNQSSTQALDYLKDVASSDLLLVSMMVASKWLVDVGEDESTSHEEWLNATNLDSSELSLLERNFIDAMDWNLNVQQHDYNAFLLEIEKRIAWKQWQLRQSSTYTDLHVLTSDNPADQLNLALMSLIADLFKVTLTCSLAYLLLLAGLSVAPCAVIPLKTTLPILSSDLELGPQKASVNSSVHLSNSSLHSFPVHHSTSSLELKKIANGATNQPEVGKHPATEQLPVVPFHEVKIYFLEYISFLSFF